MRPNMTEGEAIEIAIEVLDVQDERLKLATRTIALFGAEAPIEAINDQRRRDRIREARRLLRTMQAHAADIAEAMPAREA